MRVISIVPLIVPFGETMSLPAVPLYPIPDLVDTIEKKARGRDEEAVARARQILCETGIKAIEAEFLPVGDARQVILDQAKDWGADLIVVGSHGYPGLTDSCWGVYLNRSRCMLTAPLKSFGNEIHRRERSKLPKSKRRKFV